VLPLDNSFVTRAITPKPSITAGRKVFTWTSPLTGTPNGDAPSVLNSSYTFKAEIEVPQGGAEGMLITHGGRFGGYGFYLLKGKPKFVWNLVGLKLVQWEGPNLTPGNHTLEFDFKYEGMGAGTLAFGSYAGIGQGGTGELKVDGEVVATQKMEHTVPYILQFDEGLDVGSDTLTGVNDADYQPPFAFTGKLNEITLAIDQPKLSPEDIKKLEAARQSAAKTIE
jgi:arylsulfatase